MITLPGVILGLLGVAASVLVIRALQARPGSADMFRYDRSPYRRYCRTCGQQQNVYSHTWDLRAGSGWWRVMGAVKSPTCRCHKFAEEEMRVNQNGQPIVEEPLFVDWATATPTDDERDQVIAFLLEKFEVRVIRTNATKHGNTELQFTAIP